MTPTMTLRTAAERFLGCYAHPDSRTEDFVRIADETGHNLDDVIREAAKLEAEHRKALDDLAREYGR